jgi:DNA-binding beta-propeller fold protein YncE
MPAVAFGQWQFESVFPPDEEAQYRDAHGIAVDPDGKVWVQYLPATDSVEVAELDDAWQPVSTVHVFNSDGSPADISPIKFVEVGGETDTLGGHLYDAAGTPTWFTHAGTGLRSDHEGNIIVTVDGSPGTEVESAIVYKLDYETGEGLNKATYPARSPVAPGIDGNGNIYLADVFAGGPIHILDQDFNSLGNAIDATVGFSRGFEVSEDGNTIYWAGYTNSAVVAYQRPDEFSPYDSLGVIIPGMDSESMARQPETGYLWVSAGSPNDMPNDYEGVETNWQVQTWYAFDPADFEVDTVPTPLDSLTWQIGDGASEETDGRPRGIAFSPDGETAYVIQFNQGAPSVEVFSGSIANAIEVVDAELPGRITLEQNYPNPFNPTTSIEFAVSESGPVSLRLFDSLGRQVATLYEGVTTPGTYSMSFDGTDLSSGMYVYVLEAGGERITRSMILAK